MNPLKSQNIVAKIMQVYAYLNAIAGVILAFMVGDESEIIAIVVFAVVLVASFFIFALGEIIDLLHQIKNNTSGTPQFANDELPDL